MAVAAIVVATAAAALMPGADSAADLGPVVTHTIQRGELVVSITEQGTLESANNTEIKCKVRGDNTIISVVESGTEVKPGDELVKLDTLLIEEEISERTKFVHLAKAAVARSGADVARAKIAISEYLEGQFVAEMAALEKELAVAESNHLTAKNMLQYAQMMAKSRYVNEIEVEERQFAVSQANLSVDLIRTRIAVLDKFTKAEQLAQLNGELNAALAQHEADKETVNAEQERLRRAEEEFEYCVITAERPGMVIYPSAQEWKESPEIEEGATVHKDQVLLLMPDLTQMQVKVGIHESIIDRVRPGMTATVKLPDKELSGTVKSVAAVTKPAGWWTGNVVKYDTIVEIPAAEDLKPGMTAEVDLVLARHEGVLIVPTAAVLETRQGYACWVKTATGVQRRTLKLGDGSDMFILVQNGLEEGEEVILNPLTHVEQAQAEAATTIEETNSDEQQQD
jgi:multidrug efflux pump subunit AcrA (membrane-fusion protein)